MKNLVIKVVGIEGMELIELNHECLTNIDTAQDVHAELVASGVEHAHGTPILVDVVGIVDCVSNKNIHLNDIVDILKVYTDEPISYNEILDRIISTIEIYDENYFSDVDGDIVTGGLKDTYADADRNVDRLKRRTRVVNRPESSGTQKNKIDQPTNTLTILSNLITDLSSTQSRIEENEILLQTISNKIKSDKENFYRLLEELELNSKKVSEEMLSMYKDTQLQDIYNLSSDTILKPNISEITSHLHESILSSKHLSPLIQDNIK